VAPRNRRGSRRTKGQVLSRGGSLTRDDPRGGTSALAEVLPGWPSGAGSVSRFTAAGRAQVECVRFPGTSDVAAGWEELCAVHSPGGANIKPFLLLEIPALPLPAGFAVQKPHKPPINLPFRADLASPNRHTSVTWNVGNTKVTPAGRRVR